jgi:hypothetical protein
VSFGSDQAWRRSYIDKAFVVAYSHTSSGESHHSRKQYTYYRRVLFEENRVGEMSLETGSNTVEGVSEHRAIVLSPLSFLNRSLNLLGRMRTNPLTTTRVHFLLDIVENLDIVQ